MSENDHWVYEAVCKGTDVDFFSNDYYEKRAAKSLCKSCPVRRECLIDALKNEDRFGIWGGVEENVIRHTLAIDKDGHPIKRTRIAKCPYCKSDDLVSIEKRRTRTHIQCSKCNLDWWARRPLPRKSAKP